MTASPANERELRAAEIVARIGASTTSAFPVAGLPAALLGGEGPLPSARAMVGSLARGFAHAVWVDVRLQRAISGDPPSEVAVAARGAWPGAASDQQAAGSAAASDRARIVAPGVSDLGARATEWDRTAGTVPAPVMAQAREHERAVRAVELLQLPLVEGGAGSGSRGVAAASVQSAAGAVASPGAGGGGATHPAAHDAPGALQVGTGERPPEAPPRSAPAELQGTTGTERLPREVSDDTSAPTAASPPGPVREASRAIPAQPSSSPGAALASGIALPRAPAAAGAPGAAGTPIVPEPAGAALAVPPAADRMRDTAHDAALPGTRISDREDTAAALRSGHGSSFPLVALSAVRFGAGLDPLLLSRLGLQGADRAASSTEGATPPHAMNGSGALRFLEGLNASRAERDTRVLPVRLGPQLELVAAAGVSPRHRAPRTLDRLVARQPDVELPGGEIADGMRRSLPHAGPPRSATASGMAAGSPPGSGLDAARPVASATSAGIERGATPSLGLGRPTPAAGPAIGRVPSPALSPHAPHTPPAIEIHPPAVPGPTEPLHLRPGSLGARSEQLGGLLGLRAAGMSIDFIEPHQLPWIAEARAAVERTLLGPGVGPSTRSSAAPDAHGSPRPRAQAGVAPDAFAADSGDRRESSPPLLAARAGEPAAAPATDVGTEAWTAAAGPVGQGAGVTVAPAPFEAGFAVSGSRSLSRHLERTFGETWALLSVFPGSAPSMLPRADWRPAGVAGQAQSEGAAAAARPAPGLEPGAIAMAPAPAPARPAMPPISPATSAVTQLAPASLSAVGAGRGSSGPSQALVPHAPQGHAAIMRSSFPQVLLPDGRAPRGSFLWSHAASFADSMGEWSVPVTVEAAAGAAEAIEGGRPAWGGMPAIAAPSARAIGERAAGGPQGQARLTDGRDQGQAATVAARRLAGLPPLLAFASGREGRAAPGGQSATAADGSAVPAGAGAGRDAGLDGGGSPEFARLLVERGDAPSSRAHGATYVAASAPTAAAAPAPSSSSSSSSDAMARMLEALRSQQRSTAADDRITLGDLTLVAVASATQQLAASGVGGGDGHGAAPPAAGSGGRHHHENPVKRIEAERAEVEALARSVVEEVRSILAAERERSGEAWES